MVMRTATTIFSADMKNLACELEDEVSFFYVSCHLSSLRFGHVYIGYI